MLTHLAHLIHRCGILRTAPFFADQQDARGTFGDRSVQISDGAAHHRPSADHFACVFRKTAAIFDQRGDRGADPDPQVRRPSQAAAGHGDDPFDQRLVFLYRFVNGECGAHVLYDGSDVDRKPAGRYLAAGDRFDQLFFASPADSAPAAVRFRCADIRRPVALDVRSRPACCFRFRYRLFACRALLREYRLPPVFRLLFRASAGGRPSGTVRIRRR